MQKSGQTHSQTALFWLVMATSTGVLLLLSWRARNYQLDDGLIYLRYFRNFLEGNGLVYNKGEYFNGLTSPLYAYLMIFTGQVFSNLQALATVIATTCMATTLIVLGLYFRDQQQSWLTALGGLFCVALPYFYSTYGMETPLFMLLISASLYLYQKEKYASLAIVAALLLLTRGEGIFLLLALFIEHVLSGRKLPSWRILILPALILAAHYAFNKFYFGDFFPATGSAKIWQGKSGLWGNEFPLFLHASYLYPMFWGQAWWLLSGIVVAAIIGIVAEARKNRPILLFLLCYLAFFSLLNIPYYHWYYAPFFLFFPYFAWIGLLTIWRRLSLATPAISKTIGLPVLGVLTAAPLVFILISLPPKIGAHEDYRKIGLWLRQHTAATAQVAMVEIGTVGYYSDRPIIDILGLVNPYNAELIGTRQFDKWLDYYHPDYFLVHQPFWPHEIGVKRLYETRNLLVHPNFNFPGYQLFCRKGMDGCLEIPSPPSRKLVIHIKGSPAIHAEKMEGFIDSIRTEGARVHISGWIGHKASESDQVIHAILTGEPPLSYQINAMERQDVATHYGDLAYLHSGFEIQMDYQTPQQAQESAQHLCLVSESKSSSGKLLNSGNSECGSKAGTPILKPLL